MMNFEEFIKDTNKVESAIQVQKANEIDVFEKLANTDTSKVINAKTNQTAITLIDQDEKVNSQVATHAKDMIDTSLRQQKEKAKFNGNREACKIYGVESTVPLWQQRLMSWGSAVWFVIYFAIASFTIAPISTFAYKLNVVFKKIWVAIAVAVFAYIIALVTIFIIPFIV